MTMRFFNIDKTSEQLIEEKLESDIQVWLAQPEALVERWRKPARESMKSVQVGKRNYHYEKVKECGKFGPSYILHGKNGARYGLFKGANEELLPVNLKTKKLVKTSRFIHKNGTISWARAAKKATDKKLKESVLLEGGNAVKNELIQKLEAAGATNVHYIRIPSEQIKAAFDEIVEPLLKEIAPFLDPAYKTTFGLGSTRLAAYISGRDVKLLKSEDPQTMAKATQAKKSYGDLDIDIVPKEGVELEQIGDYLSQKYPTKIAYRKSKISAEEILMAYVWEEGKTIQIDLVKGGGEGAGEVNFMQSSSFVDLSRGVKGALQKWLMRAVLGERELTKQEKKMVKDALKSNEEYLMLSKKGWVPGKHGDTSLEPGRFQLGKGGVYVVIDLFKEGVKTRKTIKLNEKPLVDFSDINKLASFIIPGATEDELTSAVKIAEKVKETIPDSIPAIWDSFARMMEQQKGTIDIEDYNMGMKTLADILGVKWEGS
jgi:hypothetical protein